MVMNAFFRLTLAAALSAALSAPALAQGRDGRENRGGSAPRPAPVARPRAPEPMRVSPGMRVQPSFDRRPPAQHFDLRPAPARPVVPRGAPERSVRPNGAVVGRVEARGWGAPDHRGIVGAAAFATRVFAHEADERLVNHAYWHTDGSQRYAHWYDGKVHWYGFYNGPRFYWTRYEDNRWWWFDQTAGRWLYWHDNYWWWNDPANPSSAYVVVNDSYYPYAEVAAEPQMAPGAAPADSPSAMAAVEASGKGVHGNFSKQSPDGTREVQVYGDRREAFLYDRTGGEPRFIAFLAPGVKRVHFSESSGNNLQVLLLMLDGTFETFDANGRSLLPSTGNGAPATPQTPGADAVPADASSSPDAAPPAPPSSDDASAPPDGGAPTGTPPPAPPPIPGQ